MHHIMTFKIRNWKLALLALLFFCFLTSLGCWQLSRAAQKKHLLEKFAQREQQTPLTATELNENKDLRFYRAKLVGKFDNQHTMLLDNKIFNGQVGYEVYTPFYVKELNAPILIDRGFIPLGKSRKELPVIKDAPSISTVTGLLNLPPRYVALGKINDPKVTWPLRIEFVNLSQLSPLIQATSIFPYTLSLEPKHPAAYPIEWQIVTMGPERHIGYAVQWFALALTLLILFVALNRDRTGASP